jgi:integrase
MRGTVIRRGSTYSVVLELDRDPATGKRRRKWHSGYRTKRDAERARIDLLARVQQGGYVEPSQLTVGIFLVDQWLPSIRASVREGTFESYRRNVRSHLVPRLGNVPLQMLTPPRLNAFYADLLQDGRRDGSGGLSPRTVRYVHTILRRALQAAVRWQLVARNVADLADPPSPKATRPRSAATWSADELSRFLASVADERSYPLWVVLASTGMRRGEALGARWPDVDLDAGRWQVRRTLVAIGHELSESTPKTDRGRRSVALDPATVRVMREWRKHQLEERMAWGPAWTDTGRVFTREDGADLHPERVSELFDRLVKRSELPRLTVHGLRHTHATLALEAGVHPKVVQERLGHSSVAFTLDRYSHAIPAMQEAAAATVARLVGLN